MNIKARLNAVRRNGFVRSAGVLVGGTAAAQALTVLALPIITRLYTPADFSVLAVYAAIVGLTSVVACFRLEIAIPLPDEETEAANLLGLGLLLAAGSSVVMGVIIFLFGETLFSKTGQEQVHRFAWMLPIGLWLAGSYGALQYWATRKKRYVTIARTRMVQSISGISAQVGLGLAGIGPLGLMIGHALKAGAGGTSLARETVRNDVSALRSISLKGMLQALSNYRYFPQYSVWEALANKAALQIPILLIAALAVGPEAGFVILAMRTMGLPMQLVGGAVSQVYLSEAPKELRKGSLREFTVDMLRGLVRGGVPVIIFVAVVAPYMFAPVFGEEWRRAGELVAWMAPWYLLKLLSSPVSMVMHVRMKQRLMLVLMVLGLILNVAITVGAYAIEPTYIAKGYALSGMVFYLTSFVIYLKVAGGNLHDVHSLMRSAIVPATISVLLAVSVLFILGVIT